MAVSRWALTFRVLSVCCPVRRASARTHSWILGQTSSWQLVYESRASVCASWAVAPPNSLRRLVPSQGEGLARWEDSVSLCVLVRPGPAQLAAAHVPVCCAGNLGEFLLVGVHRSSEFCFPLTTVDGRRPDDISVGVLQRRSSCFRSLFEGESCPAPFTQGSCFYCFHCLGGEPAPSPPTQAAGDGRRPAVLCGRPQTVKGSHVEEDGRREEKLALMYERLRVELPGFFQKNHDYSMYAADLEFINGLLRTKSRGRVLYQLSLSLWRLLCLCYYAEVRLEVLKLTKHVEDGTIKARWRVKGLPVHSLLLRFYYKDKSQLYRTSDAFSTFYLGEDGLIHCHKVEKMMPAQPPIQPRLPSLLSRALVALGLQEQRPALNLLPLLLTSLLHTRPSQQDPD